MSLDFYHTIGKKGFLVCCIVFQVDTLKKDNYSHNKAGLSHFTDQLLSPYVLFPIDQGLTTKSESTVERILQ